MSRKAKPEGGLPVLHEDNRVIVVIKPVNVPTQEDDTGDPDLLNLLKQDIKERYAKPGAVYLGLVHRLDRPVGGVMVFAKTSKSASRLSELVRKGGLEKFYSAVLHGHPGAPEGRLKHYLLKDAKTNTVTSVKKDTPGAKEALLDYRVVGSEGGFSLVRIRLLTGRSHQIRVQFASIGCPLCGDQKYGAGVNKPGQQIALWSTEIGFEHPTTKEALHFSSLPPRTHPWVLWSEESYR